MANLVPLEPGKDIVSLKEYRCVPDKAIAISDLDLLDQLSSLVDHSPL